MGDKTKPAPDAISSSPATSFAVAETTEATTIPAVASTTMIGTVSVPLEHEEFSSMPGATSGSLTIGNFKKCKTCAGTGNVMRLECGPATPAQTLSCKYVETQCPWCGGTGYL